MRRARPLVRGARRGGLRSEIVVRLGIVMGLAVVVLVATLGWSHDRALQQVIGRALLAEARGGESIDARVDAGTSWWVVGPNARAHARGPVSAPIDARSLALAERAFRADSAIVDAGAPWEPIRFAVPTGGAGEVAVARLPAHVSLRLRAEPLAVVALLVVFTLALFVAVGLVLLQTRIVAPLERLADAARELGEGEGAVLVPVEGPLEAAELAHAFNEMSAALAARNKSLETAVADLRLANRELRRTQAGLDRAERLAVVGRLSAGVAHEVGNPLGAILGFMEVVARDPSISEASRGHLAKAAGAGEHVRRILGQLLDYSRPHRPARSAFDLAEVAGQCRDLLTAQRRYDAIEIRVISLPGAPLALGDAGAATQVLLNLMLNSADAARTSERPQVVVSIGAAPLRQRAGEAPHAVSREAFDGVLCTVADNGQGVAPEDRERIFDPFFSTKPPGEGTGLGLPTALRLAQEMDGELELSSEPPTGFVTAFTLRLPGAGSLCEHAERTRGPISAA